MNNVSDYVLAHISLITCGPVHLSQRMRRFCILLVSRATRKLLTAKMHGYYSSEQEETDCIPQAWYEGSEPA